MVDVLSSALALGADIASGQTTSQSICRMYLDQIASQNEVLRAIVAQRDTESIMADAAAADARAASGLVLGPIDGVPFTLKVIHQTAGLVTSNGDPGIYYVPETDGDICANLRKAGAVLVGKTQVGSNPVHGVNSIWPETRNPRATDYATGGSSSGAAAAVAAGLTGFDVGVDAAGSIRIPASFCGAIGFKATAGAISREGDRSVLLPSRPPMAMLDTYAYGPVTRTLADAQAILSIISGPTLARPETGALAQATNATLRKVVQINRIGPYWYLSQFVQDALDGIAANLTSSGVSVSAQDVVWFDEYVFNVIYNALQTVPAMRLYSYQLSQTPWQPTQLNYSGCQNAMLEARAHAIWLREQTYALMGDADCIITGTTALSPPMVGTTSDPAWMAYMAYVSLFNITGQPAVSIPLGIDPATGVWFGLQIIGRHWRDYDLINCAKQIQWILRSANVSTGSNVNVNVVSF